MPWSRSHEAGLLRVAAVLAVLAALSADRRDPRARRARAVGPVLRSIELFPYPELPAYKGRGSVNEASSFVGKVSNALQAATPWLGKMNNVMIWCNANGVRCRKRAMPTS